MREQTKSAIRLVEALTERAKELTCLYAIEELLNELPESIEHVCEGIIREIPAGWQFPDICVATLTLEGQTFSPEGFEETPWMLSGKILQQEREAGLIRVYYTEQMPPADIGPFLKEEDKLIQTIGDRLGHFLTYSRMRRVFQEWQSSSHDLSTRDADWASVLDLLRQTDNALFVRIAGKMLNHLCWSGVEEAETLTRRPAHDADESPLALGPSTQHTEEIFRIAGDHLSGDEILSRVQMWLQEDKLGTLAQTVLRHLPLAQVADALRRYCHTTHDAADERYPISRGLKVVLIRRILSGQLRYVSLLKDLVDIKDIYGLLQRVVYSSESHGKLGGKSAGLFLASQVLEKASHEDDTLSAVRVPKTWYVPSDMMLHFMHHNSIDEIIEQKYKPIERVRLEYPHIIETFAHSPFPPEMARGLSMALDDLGDCPLVVRSSSLLEDRMGGAFVGKYRSVFLANQGPKRQRLAALMRAVAEVYASVFGPDPIHYRSEHGLLEFGEEMGLMVQEVVGTRLGPYFLPAYSGVASSRSQVRWSPEARPEDGLIRLLPGLGTRAEDRTGEGHPVLVVPGRAAANRGCEVEGQIRSAPWKIDVLNLETCCLETVELPQLLKRHGAAFPQVELVVSVRENDELRTVSKDELDFETQGLVVTFDGLLTRSPFVLQLRSLLRCLEERHGVPVEIEFASDGERLHLLQCRPQTQPGTLRPAPIPKDVPASAVLFSANRYVSNGWVGNITHVVHVDPAGFASLDDARRQLAGRAVSRLNELLPKRQFALLAPGGCVGPGEGRGGLEIAFGDIRNAAVLVELASSADGMSFPARFLEELVAANIPYLPLFPNDEGKWLNERLLRGAPNIIAAVLPDFAPLADAIRVIDLARCAGGKLLQVMMNADLGEAVGLLTEPEAPALVPEHEPPAQSRTEDYWRWRHRMAEQIAAEIDCDRFGVVGFYLFGSTKNGTAGPASDIDLLVHFRGTETQREELLLWLEGWSLCLDEINYLKTGYRSRGLLDVHLVCDEDIARRTSYAAKIGAVTDAARALEVGSGERPEGVRLSRTTGP